MSGTNTPTSKVDVTVIRQSTGNEGTFGTLSGAGFSCFTGELSDRNNAPHISCIPKGIYKCKWIDATQTHFRKWLYQVTDVPGRSSILIHSANFMGDDTKGFKKQLEGCIALGLKTGQMDGQKALLLSKPAIRQFEDLMNKKDFMLEIK